MRIVLLSFTVLLVCSILFSCSDDDNPVNPVVPATTDTVEVAFGQSVAILGTSQTITFDSVMVEWRVPVKDQVYGVIYIDNGLAEIAMSLSGETATMRLPIDAVPPDSVGETRPGWPVRMGGYQFSLLDLSPMREQAFQIIPDSEYVATVLIEPDTLPAEVPDDFLPLKEGVSWTYIDSTWIGGDVYFSLYDVNVMNQYHDALGTWSHLNRSTEFLYTSDGGVMARGDTVYLRQHGEWLRPYGSCFSYPMTFYIEPEDPVDSFYTIVEGDLISKRYVRLIEDTSIVVPAGEFTTVYEYSGNYWVYGDCKVYVAPGVGVIFYEAFGDFRTRKAVLAAYTLPVD